MPTQASSRTAPESQPITGFLALWRTAGPDEIDDATVDALRSSLMRCSVSLHDRRWPEAARGTAAAAVGIAVDRVHEGSAPDGVAADLAMSALLPHAHRGDPAATLVLSYALQALGRARPDRGRAAALARSWAAPGGRASARRSRVSRPV